jgi:hypothetical protein
MASSSQSLQNLEPCGKEVPGSFKIAQHGFSWSRDCGDQTLEAWEDERLGCIVNIQGSKKQRYGQVEY